MDNFTHKYRTDIDRPQSRHWNRIAGVETSSDHIQLPSFRDLFGSYTTSAEQTLMGPGMPGFSESSNSKSSGDARHVQTSQELPSAYERGRGFDENTSEGNCSEPSANIDSAGRLRPIMFATPKSKTTLDAKLTSEGHGSPRRSPRKPIQHGLGNVPEPASMRLRTSKSELLPEPSSSQHRDPTSVNVDRSTSGLRET